YDAFLYTSENDGIPNILLEASAKGLVIIAPNIGGINEFVDSKTGRLIEGYEDINKFTSALKELSKDSTNRTSLVLAAQKKLQTQHSIEQFNLSVKRDI